MPVKGVANATESEPIDFEIGGTSYHIDILKDPPARVWNALRTVKPGEPAFDQDTRVLMTAIQDWDLGLPLDQKESYEDLLLPVRDAMVHLVVTYYNALQKQHQEVLDRIYRPGGGGPEDPTSGSATASESPGRSRASRRTT